MYRFIEHVVSVVIRWIVATNQMAVKYANGLYLLALGCDGSEVERGRCCGMDQPSESK